MIFTHNRDENILRPSCSGLIHLKMINNSKVLMPSDPLSGGTWMATNGNLTASILNGYKEKYIKQEKYKASRGEIIPLLFNAGNIPSFLKGFEPEGYEPFTLLVYEDRYGLAKIGWDGFNLSEENLDTAGAYIFSSVTLYDQKVMESRRKLYDNFLCNPTNEDRLWDFHLIYGEDHHHFLNVTVNNQIQTIATSQIILGDSSCFKYYAYHSSMGKQLVTIDN